MNCECLYPEQQQGWETGKVAQEKKQRKIPNISSTMDGKPILLKWMPNQTSYLLFC